MGASNHGWFFAYIFSTFTYVALVTFISASLSWYLIFEEFNELNDDHYLSLLDSWVGDYQIHLYIVVSLLLFVIGLFFLSSLLMLLSVQVRNFVSNMTTSERYGRGTKVSVG